MFRLKLPLFPVLLLALSLTACLPVSPGRASAGPITMRPVKVAEGTSVKVVNGAPGNPLQSFVEEEVAQSGLQVIATGVLSANVPVADLRYEAADTTIYRTDRSEVYTRIFEEPEAKLLLRYSYSGEINWMKSFSASLIDPTDGSVLSTYSRTLGYGQPAETVMRDFGRALRVALAGAAQ